MKFKHLVNFHKKLAKNLGEDLVYSLALDGDKIMLVVATHKSKTKRYKDKEYKTMQSCEIKATDFDKDINQLVTEITRLYNNVLENYEPVGNNGIEEEKT